MKPVRHPQLLRRQHGVKHVEAECFCIDGIACDFNGQLVISRPQRMLGGVDSDKNASPGIFIYPMNRRQRTQNIGEKAGRRMLALLQRGFIHRKVTRDEIDCLKRKTRSKLLRSFQLDSDGALPGMIDPKCCLKGKNLVSQHAAGILTISQVQVLIWVDFCQRTQQFYLYHKTNPPSR